MQLCHSPVDQAAGVPFLLDTESMGRLFNDWDYAKLFAGVEFKGSIGVNVEASVMDYPLSQFDCLRRFFPLPDTDKLADYEKNREKWKIGEIK